MYVCMYVYIVQFTTHLLDGLDTSSSPSSKMAKLLFLLSLRAERTVTLLHGFSSTPALFKGLLDLQ